MGSTCVIVVVGILVMFIGQVAYSQDEGEGGCPPLDPGSGSIRVVCEKGDCTNPRPGTVARSVWKKDVLKQTKGVAAVICKADGSWKKTNKTAGGGGGMRGKA